MENIKQWLDDFGVKKYNISNEEISVDGSVNLSDRGLTELPYKFALVTGNFDVSGNKLTSLKNCPREVRGDFDASNNKLTTLEGSPSIVKGGYMASDNKLTSLDGLPVKCDGLDVSNNKLTNLKGCPKKMTGSLNASSNELVTLEGSPSEIGGDFDISNNELTDFSGCPKKLMSSLYAANNKINSLKGLPSEIGMGFSGNLDLMNNKLSNEAFIAKNIKVNGDVFISGNDIQKKSLEISARKINENENANSRAPKIWMNESIGEPVYPARVIGDYKKNLRESMDELPTLEDFFDNDKIRGGKGQGRKDSDFCPFELALGRRVELEHFCKTEEIDDEDRNSKKLANMAEDIAKDHLSENETYYTDGFISGMFDEDVDDILDRFEFVTPEKVSKIRKRR